MTAHVNDFDSVYDIFNKNLVYVIPTFQRPYAWEEPQVSDLMRDISLSCDRRHPYHYLSPIHLIEVNSPQDEIWQNYTDSQNRHIATITASRFSDDNGGKFSVYLVVDGQQRLITLYSLLFIISGEKGNFLKFSCDEKEIPKVILNPAIDHGYFWNLLNQSSTNNITSRSQARLSRLINMMSEAEWTLEDKDFITGRNLVALLISLDPGYGLQTFLTLNDRGKALTTFEKLKSLIMEYDLDFSEPQDPVSIHKTFGRIYVILDHKDCYVDEDQFVQLSAINLWISDHIEIPSMAADTLYRNHFRVDFPSKENVGSAVHQDWLPTFSKLSNEIDHLTGILNGTDPCFNEVSTSVNLRTVGDDYLTVFNSLGLSTRSLAVLLKFREVYKCDWHEATGKIRLNNEWIKRMLTERSQSISGYISTRNIDGPIKELATELHSRIESIALYEEREISPLQLSEMMELMVFKMGSTKPGTYSGTWNSAFIQQPGVVRSCELWFDYIISYGSRETFYSFLINGQPDARDPRFRYVLCEYEFLKYKQNIHLNGALQIEHIFPQNVDGLMASLIAYGFSDSSEYQQFSQRLGNKVFLDSSLNQSIKDQPIHVKASAYVNQAHARTKAKPENQTQSSIRIGSDLQSLTDQSHYKIYLELRQMDIILYALVRF